MWERIKNLFRSRRKSAAETLKEAGDMVEAGWSRDPVQLDEAGNITSRCAATAVASVRDGNPGAWGFLQRQAGITGIWVVNRDPNVTKADILGMFRRAEAEAREARA